VLDELLADGAGAEATHVFRGRADEAGDGPTQWVAYTWREAGPVVRPAIHVLLMRGLDELQLAEFTGVEQLLHVEILAGVDHGLGHHVLKAGLLHEIDDLLALGEIGRHGHRAAHMLASLERGDGLPAVIGDG